MKRAIVAFCIVVFAISLVGCSQGKDYSGQTITGKVTSINGTEVTLLLGELSWPQIDDYTDGAGQGEGGQMPQQPQNGAAPEMPQEGQQPQDGAGQGEDGPMPQQPQNGAAPEIPQGESFPNMGGRMIYGSTFTAGDETASFNLKNTAITIDDGRESRDGSIDDICVDTILVLEVGNKNSVTAAQIKPAGNVGGIENMPGIDDLTGMNSTMPGGFGGSGQVTQGTAAHTVSLDGDYSGDSYYSAGDDENALRIDGACVTMSGVTVEKSAGASSNTEDGDFYGMNAALLATNGANVTIMGATVSSSAQNGNGVFSYGYGTAVTISDSVITTSCDNSGGIQTTGGASMNASNVTVNTSGNSSAAIRSDRGGGTVNVDGGEYTTNGYNSPAVYSTADITVKNAQLTANNSEALVIEGKNSITLENCTVSGSMSDTMGTSSDENVHTVMIYQSMSGDAEVGTSSLVMDGGELICNNGDVFHLTNTAAVVKLTGVKITNCEDNGCLMSITGNDASHGWGTAGKNGAQLVFTAEEQELNGAIVVDTISAIQMTLAKGSSFTGTINIVNNEQNGAAVADNAVLIIEQGCTWTLTGNCTLTSVTNNGNINFNGYTITLADGSVLK